MHFSEMGQIYQYCQSLGQDTTVQQLRHEILIQNVQLETEEASESHPDNLTLVLSSSGRGKNVKRLILVEFNHKIF